MPQMWNGFNKKTGEREKPLPKEYENG